jgi:hypothetical protein
MGGFSSPWWDSRVTLLHAAGGNPLVRGGSLSNGLPSDTSQQTNLEDNLIAISIPYLDEHHKRAEEIPKIKKP